MTLLNNINRGGLPDRPIMNGRRPGPLSAPRPPSCYILNAAETVFISESLKVLRSADEMKGADAGMPTSIFTGKQLEAESFDAVDAIIVASPQ